jgi:hypothetical protein
MNARLRQIAQRRRALVAEAAEQRGQFAADAGALRQSLDWVDAVRRGGQALRNRPLLVGTVAAGFMLVGPGRLLRLAYRTGLVLPLALRVLRLIRALR